MIIRRQLGDLFTGYSARIRIVYVEAEPAKLFQQNRNRDATVPEDAMQRMMERWEVSDVTEADEVEWWVREGRGDRAPFAHPARHLAAQLWTSAKRREANSKGR